MHDDTPPPGRFEAFHTDVTRKGYADVRALKARYGLPTSTVHRQLRALGFSPGLPALWLPPGAKLSHREQALMVADHLGPGAVFTATTALHAQGIIGEPDGPTHVMVRQERWRQVSSEHICFHHTSVPARTLTWRGEPLRVTFAARALAEQARHSDFRCLARDCATAIRLRRCRLKDLDAELARRGRFPGRRLFREVVAGLHDELNHSGGERLGRRLLRESGEDTPSRPEVVCLRGVKVAEVDLLWLSLLFGVEIDGPHHMLPEVVAADRVRDALLRRELGIEIARYWWYEVEDEPERFVREVRVALAARRA